MTYNRTCRCGTQFQTDIKFCSSCDACRADKKRWNDAWAAMGGYNGQAKHIDDDTPEYKRKYTAPSMLSEAIDFYKWSVTDMGKKHLDKVCATHPETVLNMYMRYEDNVNEAMDILWPGDIEKREEIWSKIYSIIWE